MARLVQRSVLLVICILLVVVGRVTMTPTVEDEYYDEYEDGSVGVNYVAQPSSAKPITQATEEYEYEYEYEYEEDVDGNGALLEEETTSPVRGPEYNGYVLHGSAGLMRIEKPMVDEVYLNESTLMYDCPKKEEAFILMLEADPEMDDQNADMLMKQVNDLRQRMEQVHKRFNAITNETLPNVEEKPILQVNATVNTTSPADSNNKPKRRLTFRDKQALKMQERKEKLVQREKLRPKFRLGADCETLLCGSCKALVDEFAVVVYNNINNPKKKYLDQVFDGFCDSKEVLLKYTSIVNDTCRFFEEVIPIQFVGMT
jgi:hypothetical protein